LGDNSVCFRHQYDCENQTHEKSNNMAGFDTGCDSKIQGGSIHERDNDTN
jgi:hypothetical protein